MGAAQLVVLHVSPWSERARWALDHHGIAFREIQHAPFLGERKLRKLVGPGPARATVPVLVDGEQVITQSWDIAAHADAIGNGAKLLPADRVAEIRAWVDELDAASNHGRALVIRGMLASSAALDEGLPPEVPGFMRPLLRPITRYGTRWFARKYALDLDAKGEHLQVLRSVLDRVRARLGGGRYLFGSFGYADIASASFLQAVVPVDDRWLRLGPATRAVWTQPELAADYDDLVRWRDQLYRDHRKRE
jgi:glutathione S-transferase